jgi:hypothetical protein
MPSSRFLAAVLLCAQANPLPQQLLAFHPKSRYKSAIQHATPLLNTCPGLLFVMLAPAAFHRRLLVVATSLVALVICASLIAVLQPHAAASSQLSAARFYGIVSPDLARLMSRKDDDQLSQADYAGLQPSSASSSRFYNDVSRTLGHLMAKRGVLAEDAAELRGPSPALRLAVPQHLPYDEAVTLGSPISASAFQRAAATVDGPRQVGGTVSVCHACVRAAAAAAEAKAAAAEKNRVEKAAEENLRALRQKQQADAAAAAAKLAKQGSLIAQLQVQSFNPQSRNRVRVSRLIFFPARRTTAASRTLPCSRWAAASLRSLAVVLCVPCFSRMFFQMQDELWHVQAQARLQKIRDAAAVAQQLKAMRHLAQQHVK